MRRLEVLLCGERGDVATSRTWVTALSHVERGARSDWLAGMGSRCCSPGERWPMC